MYYFPIDPPYFLLVAGFLIGITCGTAFDATLKQNVAFWSKNRSKVSLSSMENVTLRLPFAGINAGIAIFLTSGLAIFGFPNWLALSVAMPLTIIVAALLWIQLRIVFR